MKRTLIGSLTQTQKNTERITTGISLKMNFTQTIPPKEARKHLFSDIAQYSVKYSDKENMLPNQPTNKQTNKQTYKQTKTLLILGNWKKINVSISYRYFIIIGLLDLFGWL